MADFLRDRLEVIAFVLLCSLGSLSAAWQVRNWGDALSPVDSFSEANAIREAHNFLLTGIAANSGLGNVWFPGLYPDEGFAADPDRWSHSLTPSGVYTHYPPGPEYLLYAAMRVLGPHPVAHLRALPLIIFCAAAIFFGLSMRRRFGNAVGWLVMLACAALPVFSDAAASLHFLGYASALLLIELGVAVGKNRLLWPFLALGFLQGWLSFDYVFLVTLAPGAIELAMPRLGIGHTARPRLAMLRCLAAGGGFALAHVLHFTEVWAFFGSFHAALADMGDAATYRSGSATDHGFLHRLVLSAEVLKFYFFGSFPISLFLWHPDAGVVDNWRVFRFAGFTLGVWWVLILLACVIAPSIGRPRTQQIAGERQLARDWLLVTLCGAVLCSLWYVLMLNHAIIHTHFLYRHLFLCFFLGVLFCATALANASTVTVAMSWVPARVRACAPQRASVT